MALSMRSSVASGTRGFLGKSVRARATNGVKATMRAGNWLPGSDAPAWLPDDIPGNFGFDPLGLAKDPASLARFREAELIHCRWSMLAAAGILLPEILGYGNFIEATKWPETAGARATWFGIENPIPDVPTLLIISHILFILSEGLRNEEKDPAKKLYPGGAFDPLGFSKDSAKIAEYQLKEIKNGRLAMVAVLGFASAYAATGKGPIAALSEHIANPWTVNFTTNGVSVPFF